jgi:hypothetical protein
VPRTRLSFVVCLELFGSYRNCDGGGHPEVAPLSGSLKSPASSLSIANSEIFAPIIFEFVPRLCTQFNLLGLGSSQPARLKLFVPPHLVELVDAPILSRRFKARHRFGPTRHALDERRWQGADIRVRVKPITFEKGFYNERLTPKSRLEPRVVCATHREKQAAKAPWMQFLHCLCKGVR